LKKKEFKVTWPAGDNVLRRRNEGRGLVMGKNAVDEINIFA